MKKFTLTFMIFSALCAAAYSGSYSSKEVMQQAPSPTEWYRAHEWDLSVWGTYAFPGNSGGRSRAEIAARDTFFDVLDPEPGTTLQQDFDEGHTNDDRFINRDGALGGGADMKFFFAKWWGLGLEGFLVDANDNIGGAYLATATFRFPIGRFAPYIWGGFGGLGGGSHQVRVFREIHTSTSAAGEELEGTEIHIDKNVLNKHQEAMCQVGGGFEYRVTRHVGLMADFAWNVASGPDNDFGMGRFGVTFSY